ncbi:universal stress protein [Mucilaginibacter aquariorum]|uniref:Universal stress protein n=1 Tax=Mucilaginibacter aquariorum TaxID=2967225 RepID=A0ABT1T2I3_9SPHI|nr:universal stress protein [Mucilaginibacter aquariorum]MCQ6958767.1 universal stress protein [Mucilaginibacter aquariorum]
MEKILVTTDQSANSKAAIRFAIALAKQRKAQLTVLHVYHLLKPFKWTEQQFAAYTEEFCQKTTSELTAFVAKIYHELKEPDMDYQLVLVSNMDVVEGIITYASQQGYAYICISTRGAGAVRKLFGTHTAKLISSSPVPVISVPRGYRLTPVKEVLYAADMTDYEVELKKVADFARPLHATVSMVHISYPYELLWDKAVAEDTLRKKANYDINLLTPPRDLVNALMEDLELIIKKRKPSLLVLFTHQTRSLFDKLFLPSNAETYSFHGKIPMLTYKKEHQ